MPDTNRLTALLLPAPTPDQLRALQADMSRQAGHDLSAREMGEWLGYQGRGVADKRWREYLAGRPLDPLRYTLAMLASGRHPTRALKAAQRSAAPTTPAAP